MSIEKTKQGGFRIRWYENGRGSRKRSRTFDRRKDAQAFEGELRRQRQSGGIARLDAATIPFSKAAEEWFDFHAIPNLAKRTLRDYTLVLDRYLIPQLGGMRLCDIGIDTLQRFRVDLEREGVGRQKVRVCLVVAGAILERAVKQGHIDRNVARHVAKPSGQRQREITVPSPSQIEEARHALLDKGQLLDATLISVMAYSGMRPQEALALEWRHVRERTLLVEQKNTDGEIVPGQKVRGRWVRSVDLLSPLKDDLNDYRGGRHRLLFSMKGKPWVQDDFERWRKRVFKRVFTGCTPYDLRHAFASLRLREGIPVTDLADQLGHSPQMTLSTYAHTMRELKGTPQRPAADVIREARAKYASGDRHLQVVHG